MPKVEGFMDTFTETSCVHQFNPQTVVQNLLSLEHPSAKGTQHLRYSHNSFLSFLSHHKSCCSSLHKVQFEKGKG